VTVYLPPGQADSAPDKKLLEAGAAATAAAQQAEEEQPAKQKPK